MGVPFNIASYAFLTNMIASVCNLEPKEFIYTIGDAHIYEQHIEHLEKQVEKEPYEFPKLKLNHKTDIDDFVLSDFKIENYKYHPTIKMKMII